MRWVLRIGIVLLGAYVLLCVAACAFQRSLLFPAPPPRLPLPPSGTTVETRGNDGRPVFAWYLPASTGFPTLVFFHGNGEQVSDLDVLGRMFRTRGFGFYAVEYPGYGIAHTQSPSESALFDAADGALRHLHGPLGVPVSDTVLVGQSLGTGVATEMARRGLGARLALLSPYTSIVDMAHRTVGFLPTSLLVRDRFDTASRAPGIVMPVLIVHGDRDTLIPVEMGRTLATRFPHATLRIVPGRGHNDLFAYDDTVIDVLSTFAREATPAR